MKPKLLYFLILIMLILNGCTPDVSEEIVQEPLAITVDGADREIIERSETLSDVVVELYGIDDATSIILNDVAIIGVKVAYEEKLKDETRAIIEESVKNQDSGIDQVVITDKARLFNEINDIVTEVLQGKSFDNYVNDINNIKNRIR